MAYSKIHNPPKNRSLDLTIAYLRCFNHAEVAREFEMTREGAHFAIIRCLTWLLGEDYTQFDVMRHAEELIECIQYYQQYPQMVRDRINGNDHQD